MEKGIDYREFMNIIIRSIRRYYIIEFFYIHLSLLKRKNLQTRIQRNINIYKFVRNFYI